MPRRSAFTLIELLVVITIIVVLLALLTPALDSALYQAELAVCGAQVEGIGSGVTVYAVAYRRQYPDRPQVHAVGGWQNDKYFDPGVQGDVRRVTRDYVSAKALLDPLVEEVDFTLEGQSHGYGPYSLWFGWFFRGPERGMFKLNDRFTFKQDSFDVLVSDFDLVNYTAYEAAAHPDRDGVMAPYSQDNEESEIILPGTTAGVPTAGTRFTQSFWLSPVGSRRRGTVDTSFARTDGSVSRFLDVRWDETLGDDGRFVNVPWQSDNAHGEAQLWTHLPDH